MLSVEGRYERPAATEGHGLDLARIPMIRDQTVVRVGDIVTRGSRSMFMNYVCLLALLSPGSGLRVGTFRGIFARNSIHVCDLE